VSDYDKGVQLGEELLGSCLEEPDHVIEDGNMDFIQGMESVAVRCDRCSWWVTPCDNVGECEIICSQCYDEGNF